MFNDTKYTKWYYHIIKVARDRILDGYAEKHHVVPKSLGGSNKKENIVSLTAREHFICHWLLTKMVSETKHKYQMWNAFSCMLYRNNDHQQRYKVNSRTFNAIKEQGAKIKSVMWSGENNPMYGIRGASNPNFGKLRSAESIQKRREAQLGKARPHVRGRKQSPEQIAKRVAARQATLMQRKLQGV
jgi:hypothetical protein